MYNPKTQQKEDRDFNSPEERIAYFNYLNEVIVINLYTLSKEKNKIFIRLPEDRTEEEEQRLVVFLNSAINIGSVFHKKVYLSTTDEGEFNKFILYYYDEKGFDDVEWKLSDKGEDCDKMLSFIAEANDVPLTIFNEIYEEFFKDESSNS